MRSEREGNLELVDLLGGGSLEMVIDKRSDRNRKINVRVRRFKGEDSRRRLIGISSSREVRVQIRVLEKNSLSPNFDEKITWYTASSGNRGKALSKLKEVIRLRQDEITENRRRKIHLFKTEKSCV